jgi:NAD(P)-dependent dehydrogenase (short-subunit alcohol dehydrogenase family)
MPVAIVTGASRGFGHAVTAELVKQGWDVVIDGRDGQALDAAAAELRAANPAARVLAVAGDVADPAHRTELVSASWSLGGLDLLVNNASVLGPSPQPLLRDYPLDVLEHVYRVNVLGPVGLIQESLRSLEKRHGAVVNITSDAAVEGYEGWGGYGSSKAALEQVSRVLAAEQPDVRVYWFDPGDMRTQMHQEAFPGEDISDRPLPETVVPALVRLLADSPPSGRYRAADLATDVAVAAS